jgi:diguanylate cyclase (GGDEF)-like protein/PAS domain S-box-containing protein
VTGRDTPEQIEPDVPLPHATPKSRLRSLGDPESLREFTRNLREGIYINTRDGRFLDANPAFLDMVGVKSIADLSEYNADDLLDDPRQRAAELEAIEREGAVREFELTMRRPDGGRRTVLDTCYVIRDSETGEEFVHGILVDITARKALEEELLEMSTHDALTGCLNRRALLEVEEAFARDADLRCGCIFVDIDHFKRYNDEQGHQAGDEVLVRMARFLMRYIRAEESVLRLGGDEFVVLLNGADAERTQSVAERLRHTALRTAPVPFSLGAAAREPGESLAHLLDRADQGLLAVRVDRPSGPRAALRRETDR